jgi:hypothetical protein
VLAINCIFLEDNQPQNHLQATCIQEASGYACEPPNAGGSLLGTDIKPTGSEISITDLGHSTAAKVHTSSTTISMRKPSILV